MSVGDFVKFEDGEIMVCAAMGWRTIPAGTL